ncbi:hypothetical protein BH11ACT7_BH11ACT7_41080 [soil metagenome]
MPEEPVEEVDADLARLADLALPDPAAVPVEPATVAPEDSGYTPGGVPTFDAVREKIETRFGTAMGHAELDADTAEGRSVDEQYEARQRAAAERLAQIRESMKSADR